MRPLVVILGCLCGLCAGAGPLEDASVAMAEHRPLSADAHLRSAWCAPSTRREAARRLRELHDASLVEVQVDERAVSATGRLLGRSFRRYETRHFVILSDCSVAWTRARGSLLERTRDQYFRMADRLEVPVIPHEHKLLCVLFDDPDQYGAFARAHDGLQAEWVAGYFATRANRVVFYNDDNAPGLQRALGRLEQYEGEAQARRAKAGEADRRQDADRAERLLASARDIEQKVAAERARLTEHTRNAAIAKTIHEAVHLLAFNTGLQRSDRDYPFWLSEGLATNFETSTPSASFGPEDDTESRLAGLKDVAREGSWIDLARLVTLTEAPADDSEMANAMYHLSYALFAYLYRHDRRALGAYLMAFQDEPAGPISKSRQMELFRTYFGEPRKIERRLLAEFQLE